MKIFRISTASMTRKNQRKKQNGRMRNLLSHQSRAVTLIMVEIHPARKVQRVQTANSRKERVDDEQRGRKRAGKIVSYSGKERCDLVYALGTLTHATHKSVLLLTTASS